MRTDSDLAQALAQIDVGRVIPADLYPAVAEVLAYVYRMNNRRPPR
ncbi:MAG: EscU/YscU/HrcU family type III secretion system export apparatus switch protein [Planctomycetota bacterium]|nr:EscU/YscU/HrcU family type III secretion system export apparatus switch protein [Planctomycetota bacterium]